MAAPTPEAVNDPSRSIPRPWQPWQSPASGILPHKGGSENAESKEPKRSAPLKEPRPNWHCPRSARGWARVRNFASIRVLELLGSETVATVS